MTDHADNTTPDRRMSLCLFGLPSPKVCKPSLLIRRTANKPNGRYSIKHLIDSSQNCHECRASPAVPLWCSGFGIQHCHCSRSGPYCGAGLIPGLGTSSTRCMGVWTKKLTVPSVQNKERLSNCHSQEKPKEALQLNITWYLGGILT